MMEQSDRSLVRHFSVQRVDGRHSERVLDHVANEEPLEMRVRYWFKDVQIVQSLAVTMRTPGHDRELAAGFLLSEGVIRARDEIIEIAPCLESDAPENTLNVFLAP